ncbi:hypothetical protein Tco_0629263 [Tanacetum coccineum]|uniref:Uncharacterized protein n=1 Tax=Tanacetum coccineum TaxID=301880 RepID=A0ABQ4WSN5_9ASTR
MVEEPLKMKKKDQVLFDEQEAIRIQAQFDEEARIVREKEEANAALITQWNDIQDKLETDYELAQRLQAEEQEELTIKEKSKLKLVGGSKVRAEGRVTREESSSKRARDELKHEKAKKQKPIVIVDYKIHKKGNQGYYEIIRADGSSKIYLLFSQLIKSFDREDLETMWKLVKAKHGNTRPEEGYKRVLWGDLKTMFEHHVEDLIWMNLQGKKVLLWRLYDSCGIHFVRFEDMHVYMLVEKRYPLTPATITEMLNRKLQADNFNEMYQASCGRRAKLNQSYLARIVESLLKDLQILNEIQPLRQETSNQIQKDQEEKSIAELLAEERLQKANQALNESQSPQEMRIKDLEIQKQHLDKSMSKHWKCGIIYKKQKSLEESEARARSQKIIIDDDDDIWGFYAVHPNTIHTFVSQNVWGKCNLFDINDSYYEKSTSRLAHLAPISPEIVEACVDDDDTDDDDDYDDDFYDCVDIKEDGGEIDLDISKIVDISLRR